MPLKENHNKNYRWVPIFGEFEINENEDSIVFKGRQVQAPTTGDPQPKQPPIQPTVGVILCNQMVTSGRLSAEIMFENVTPLSACELILGYDLKSKGMITAGLGGNFSMFSIREWNPGPTPIQPGGSWITYETIGDRLNLRSGVKYDVSARLEGSNISLEVDGVQVSTITLPAAPNQQHQVGIFCVGESKITINHFHVESELPRAFIVMQFSSPYNEVYLNVIKAVCEEMDIEAVRADELYGSGLIIKDIIDLITRSHVIIADISPANPNVYFEVGYALALSKPIILLAQRREPGNQLPFDISSFRVLFYDDSISGKPKLEEGLRNHLREILGKEKLVATAGDRHLISGR